MRTLFIGDIHAGSGYKYGRIDPFTGNNTRLDDVIQILDEIKDYIANPENRIDLVYFVGDLYRECNGVADTKRMELMAKALKAISIVSPLGLKIVVGNHDIFYGNTNVYFDIKTWAPEKIEVFDVPTYDPVLNAICLPYFNVKNALDPETIKAMNREDINFAISGKMRNIVDGIVATVPEEKKKDLLSVFHFTVSEAEYKDGIFAKWGQDIILPAETMNGHFKYSFGGHIHAPQQIDNIHYVGSIMPVEKSEGQKRFIVYDSETDQVESHDIDHRKFHIIEHGDHFDAGLVGDKDIVLYKCKGTREDLAQIDFEVIRAGYKNCYWFDFVIEEVSQRAEKNKGLQEELLKMNPDEVLRKYFEEKGIKNINPILEFEKSLV